MQNAKKWGIRTLTLVIVAIVLICAITVLIDPYFHYHKPNPHIYYELRNERYVNDGILRHFDYDALIAGTSMTENFKNTEFEQLFGVRSVKIPLRGASYKEVNDSVRSALEYNPGIRIVIRGLEPDSIVSDASRMNYDIPYYLYDDDHINDIRYLLSIDTIKSIVLDIVQTIKNGGGVESFDEYAFWGDKKDYGEEVVREGISIYNTPKDEVTLSDDDINIAMENIDKNVISIAREHPEVEFYYFIAPYGIGYWYELNGEGGINRHIDAEKLLLTSALEYDNIHMYSFNNEYDMITDLNNYTVTNHYGDWINSLILDWMKDGRDLITKENLEDYIDKERRFYTDYDYEHLWD